MSLPYQALTRGNRYPLPILFIRVGLPDSREAARMEGRDNPPWVDQAECLRGSPQWSERRPSDHSGSKSSSRLDAAKTRSGLDAKLPADLPVEKVSLKAQAHSTEP